MRSDARYALLGLLLAGLVLPACGGGGGGGGGTPASVTTTISGIATKGPIAGAVVDVLSLTSAGALDQVLAGTTTDANGAFQVSLATPLAPFALRITGTSAANYRDESTGGFVAFRATNSLLAFVPTPAAGPMTVNVTPLTHMAALRIQQLAPSSTTPLSALAALINVSVGAQFNISDILAVTPADLTDATTDSAGAEATEYALVLAGLSQEAEDIAATDPTVTSLALAAAMAQDFQSDGLFNGLQNTTAVTLGSGLLPATSATSDLATDIGGFLSSPQNASGITAAAAGSFTSSFAGTSVPAAPTGVSASGGDGAVTLTWNAASGVTSYNVYMAVAPGVTPANYASQLGGMRHLGVSSPFLHTGLSNNTTYYFVVTAVNAAGEGAASAEVTATPQGGGSVPTAPTGVGAAAGNAQFSVSWYAVSGASSYNVYMATQTGVTRSNYATLLGGMRMQNATSPFTHTGLVNGTPYYAVVTALNAAGESVESAEVSATPTAGGGTAPAAPGGVSASAGDAQVTVTWNAVTGATSYNIYMAAATGVTRTNYGTLTGGMRHVGATSPYAHTGLTNGTTYYFVVTAVNSAGESAESTQVSAAPAAAGALPKRIVMTTRTMPAATAGMAYSQTLAVYGDGPYTWDGSTIAPSGPVANNGVSIGTSSGVLSGTTTYTGTQPLFLSVQGANGAVGIQYDLPIGGSGSTQNIVGIPPSGTQGVNYDYEFRASWDQLGWSSCGNSTWVFGSIPPGMTWNPLTHHLFNPPTHAGAFTFTFFTDPVTTACGPAPTNFETVTVTFGPGNPSTSPAGASNWVRQGLGAVLSPGSAGAWDAFMIGSPSVVKVGAIYYLFYEGQNDTDYRYRVGLATSSDGSAWTQSAYNPVLSPGAAGTWDARDVRYPTVYHDGTKFWMWYQGSDGSATRIGLATSTDGITWTKDAANPVSSSTGLISAYCPGGVVHNGAQFVLFYSADGSIGRMTSANGTAWTDAGAVFNPMSGTDTRFSRPDVVLDAGTYRMWYTRIEALGGGAGNPNSVYPITIGYADSPDGVTWTTYGNPIFTAGAEGAWDRPGVGIPSVIKDGTAFKMWYAGGRGNLPGTLFDANAFVEGSIGYATSQ